MQVPSRTTKIDPKHILIIIILVSAIPIYILLPSTVQEPCTHAVIPFWNGEYPEPVVVIKKKTTHVAYVDLCLEDVFDCTILPGMVHPWSKEKRRYVSKPAAVLYRSSTSFSSDLKDYDIGTEVFYEGETPDRMCSFRVDSDRWYTSCQFLEELTHVSGDQGAKARQFFFTTCEEGSKGWIEVREELFNDVSIDRGLIKGYGIIDSK